MSTLYRQPTNAPTRKVRAAGIAGAVAALVAWALAEFAGVAVPPGVESALAVLVAWVAAYATREST